MTGPWIGAIVMLMARKHPNQDHTMSHLDDPDHARTPTSPREAITGSQLDNLASTMVVGKTPEHARIWQDGWDDAMSTYEAHYGDQPFVMFLKAPVPDVLKQGPSIPGSVTRAGLEPSYLLGAMAYWHQRGVEWARFVRCTISDLDVWARTFEVPDAMLQRIIAGQDPIAPITRGAVGYTIDVDDALTDGITIQLLIAAQLLCGTDEHRQREREIYNKWIVMTREAETLRRLYLYRTAFLQGCVHEMKLAVQLAEQVRRGGASAGVSPKQN